jgi:hypothetical protein
MVLGMEPGVSYVLGSIAPDPGREGGRKEGRKEGERTGKEVLYLK